MNKVNDINNVLTMDKDSIVIVNNNEIILLMIMLMLISLWNDQINKCFIFIETKGIIAIIKNFR